MEGKDKYRMVFMRHTSTRRTPPVLSLIIRGEWRVKRGGKRQIPHGIHAPHSTRHTPPVLSPVLSFFEVRYVFEFDRRC